MYAKYLLSLCESGFYVLCYVLCARPGILMWPACNKKCGHWISNELPYRHLVDTCSNISKPCTSDFPYTEVRAFLFEESPDPHSRYCVVSFPFVMLCFESEDFFQLSQAKLGNIISLWLPCKWFIFLKGKVNFTSSEGRGGLAVLL